MMSQRVASNPVPPVPFVRRVRAVARAHLRWGLILALAGSAGAYLTLSNSPAARDRVHQQLVEWFPQGLRIAGYPAIPPADEEDATGLASDSVLRFPDRVIGPNEGGPIRLTEKRPEPFGRNRDEGRTVIRFVQGQAVSVLGTIEFMSPAGQGYGQTELSVDRTSVRIVFNWSDCPRAVREAFERTPRQFRVGDEVRIDGIVLGFDGPRVMLRPTALSMRGR